MRDHECSFFFFFVIAQSSLPLPAHSQIAKLFYDVIIVG